MCVGVVRSVLKVCRSVWVWLFVLILKFGLLLVSGLDTLMGSLRYEDRRHLPIPQGPYPVGCVDLMTEYSPDGCFVRLYYPAAQEGGIQARSMQWPLWIPTKQYVEGYANMMDIWKPIFKTMFGWLIGDVYIPALWSAPPIRGMKFPILIFSHGLGGCRTTYSTVCTEITSHGFIVAAVEHRDNSACLSYYIREVSSSSRADGESHDSTLIQDDLGPGYVTEYVQFQKVWKPQKEYTVRNRQVHQRSSECKKALDVLLAINKGEFVHNVMDSSFSGSIFENIMDVSRIAIAGHSFGGATVIPTLATDKRFSVGVALDSWMFPIKDEQECFASVTQPMLFINMEHWQTEKNLSVMRQMESREVERRMVTIRGTRHLNQSDIPFMTGPCTRRLFAGASSINRFLAMEINNKLMLSFLWKHLDIPLNAEFNKFLESQQSMLIEGTVIR